MSRLKRRRLSIREKLETRKKHLRTYRQLVLIAPPIIFLYMTLISLGKPLEQALPTIFCLTPLVAIVLLFVPLIEIASTWVYEQMFFAPGEKRRERALEKAELRELKRHGQDPEKIARKLESGAEFHLNGDGEIVFDEDAKKRP